jgi:hypothetical protein
MILCIHQPSYFPWLGLLDKIAKSDVYMVMDEVQLTDDAFQHRNLFLTVDGKEKYLTIPLNKKDYLHRPFKDLEIADQTWNEKHLNFIKNNYRKHPFYKDIIPAVEEILSQKYEKLIDIVVASMRLSFTWFNISTKIIFQSEMVYDRTLRKGGLVIALIKAAGADCYLSGTGAQAYLDESEFGRDIKLLYNHFSHPIYKQYSTAEFIPGLACLDAIFNIGIEGTCGLVSHKAR